MYFLSKICVLCLNTSQVTKISENKIYKQILFAIPELNILAAENDSYICTACLNSVKNFGAFKKLCIENYYRWKSYKNLVGCNNGTQNEKFGDMQIKLPNIVHNINSNVDDNIAFNYNLHSEIEIKTSQPFLEIYEHNIDNSNSEISEASDHTSKKLNQYSQSESVKQKQNEVTMHKKVNIEKKSENRVEQITGNNFNFNIPREIDHNSEKLQQYSQSEPAIKQNENDTLSNHLLKIEQKLKKIAQQSDHKCNECGKTFSARQAVKRHLLIHAGVKEFKCRICEKEFRWKGDLTKHMLVHTNEKKFECEICHRKYVYHYSMTRHFKTCSNGNKCTQNKKGTAAESNNNNKKCRSESKTNQKETQLNKDKQNKENKNCSKINITLLENDIPKKINLILQHVSPKSRKFNQLMEQELTAQEKDAILENISNISNKKKTELKCFYCNKQLPSSKQWTKHMESHPDIKELKCSECNVKYPDKNSLFRHLKVHLNETKHICQFCNKEFQQNCILIRHVKFHLGIRTHECPICKRKFTEKHSVKLHLKTHSDTRRTTSE